VFIIVKTRVIFNRVVGIWAIPATENYVLSKCLDILLLLVSEINQARRILGGLSGLKKLKAIAYYNIPGICRIGPDF